MEKVTKEDWLQRVRIQHFILGLKEGGASRQEATQIVAKKFNLTEISAEYLVKMYWIF